LLLTITYICGTFGKITLALLVKVCMVYKVYGENTRHLNIINVNTVNYHKHNVKRQHSDV